jgi:hypothetical protein
MNNSLINYFILCFAIIFFSAPVNAQVNNPKLEIGAMLSGFVYQGDLTPKRYGSFETTRPGFSLFGSILFSPSFALRGNFSYGGLKGDDAVYKNPAYRQQRNFNFRTPVTELSVLLSWCPLGDQYGNRRISPYLFAGGGINFLRIKRDWSQFNASHFGEEPELVERLAEDQAQTPPRSIPVIPVGAGFRYRLSERIAVNVESSYRLLFTDYLDGFSRAANPEKKDHYHTTSAGISYRIGKKDMLGCPVVKY